MSSPRRYFAPHPASTLISVPVQNEASSEFKKKIAFAISPGCANLFLTGQQKVLHDGFTGQDAPHLHRLSL